MSEPKKLPLLQQVAPTAEMLEHHDAFMTLCMIYFNAARLTPDLVSSLAMNLLFQVTLGVSEQLGHRAAVGYLQIAIEHCSMLAESRNHQELLDLLQRANELINKKPS